MDQSPGSFILGPVITGQVANEDVRIDAEHQRDSSAIGTAFLPFLCRSPARSDTCLFFTRMTTTPSGINVNVNRHNLGWCFQRRDTGKAAWDKASENYQLPVMVTKEFPLASVFLTTKERVPPAKNPASRGRRTKHAGKKLGTAGA